MNARRDILIAFVFLFLSAGLILTSLWTEGPTYDEPVYIMAGHAYLTSGRFDINPEHPPAWKELAAIPLVTAGVREPVEPWNDPAFSAETIFRLARMPGVVLFLFTGWLVFLWSKELWGAAGGLVSLFLYALSPNLLAFARLVTPDFPAAASWLIAFYTYWKFCRDRSNRNLCLSGLALGFALGCRHSSLLLLPLFLVIHHLYTRTAENEVETEGKDTLVTRYLPILKLFGSSFLVLAICYGFVGLPNYFSGVWKFASHAASSGHEAFLLGRHSNRGWWHYFLVAIALKTPVPTLLCTAAALVFWKKGKTDRTAILFLWLPIAIFLVTASLNKVNLGLRLILPIYPLLFVGLGRLATLELVRKPAMKIALAVLGLWYFWGAMGIHPGYISYFNEFAGPSNGYKYLSDSNVDWGQDLPRLGVYMRENGVKGIHLAYFGYAPPSYYGIRFQFLPTGDKGRDSLLQMDSGDFRNLERPRLLAISVTLLKGVPFGDHSLYSWLEEREPVGRVGHSILVYDITRDPRSARILAETYSNFGLSKLAEFEANVVAGEQ